MIWKKVKDSNTFEVSSTGRVRNIKTGTILKHTITKNGMHRVTLNENGVQKNVAVCELMADAFFDGESETRDILFIDGNPGNLAISNLKVTNGLKTRRIMCYETGEIFNSQAECCRAMSIPSGPLSRCLSGKVESYKGLHFKWIECGIDLAKGKDF